MSEFLQSRFARNRAQVSPLSSKTDPVHVEPGRLSVSLFGGACRTKHRKLPRCRVGYRNTVTRRWVVDSPSVARTK